MMHVTTYNDETPPPLRDIAPAPRSHTLALRVIEAAPAVAGESKAPPRLKIYDRIRFYTHRLANFALQTQPRTSTGMAL